MILVKMSSLAKATIHKCLPKARYSSVFSLGFSFLIISLVCCSCSSTKEIPLKSLHEYLVHDTIVLHNIQYDSFYVASNHYIDRSKDTILIKDKQIEYRYRLLRDTIFVKQIEIKHDSIPYKVRITEVKQVKYIPPWVKPLAFIGAISLLVLLIYIFTKLKRF